MFNWFKKKKQKDEGIEYSFIWYKKLESGNKTYYTRPFRTKVKANSIEEAQEKVKKFALGKMKLVLINEDKLNKIDLSRFERGLDNLTKQMDELFENLN